MRGLSSLIFLALLIGIFYFMLIRPQKKRADQHRNLVNSLEVGDEVVTIGGLFGRIGALDDEGLDLEIAPRTTVRVLKSAVARKITDTSPDEDESAVVRDEEAP